MIYEAARVGDNFCHKVGKSSQMREEVMPVVARLMNQRTEPQDMALSTEELAVLAVAVGACEGCVADVLYQKLDRWCEGTGIDVSRAIYYADEATSLNSEKIIALIERQ